MKICFDRSTIFNMDSGGGAAGGPGSWYARVSGLWNTMTTSLRLHTAAGTGGVANMQKGDQRGGVSDAHRSSAYDQRGVSHSQMARSMSPRMGGSSPKSRTKSPKGGSTMPRGGTWASRGGAKDLRRSYSNGSPPTGVRLPEGDPGSPAELSHYDTQLGHEDLDMDDEMVESSGSWENVWVNNPLEKTITVQYIGSFTVHGEDQNARAEYVRKQLCEMKEVSRTKPVLLVISLSGIKVCSSSGESVYMAHALKRISYATCDPEHRQFSFLAREPKGHTTVQYCHAFVTATPDQAEELNNIVGNAFKMAYAYQRQTEQTQQPTFHELIEQQLEEQRSKQEQMEDHRQQILQQKLKEISTATIAERVRERKERRRLELDELERERAQARLQGKDRVNWAKHNVGKSKHKAPFSDEVYQRHSMYASASPSKQEVPSHGVLNQSGASISMSALREAFEANDLRSHGSPVMALKETIDSHFNNGAVSLSPDVTDGETYLCPVVSTEPYPQQDAENGQDLRNNIANRPLPATPSSSSDDSNRKSSKKDRGSGSSKSRKSSSSSASEARRSLVLASPRDEAPQPIEMRNANGHNNHGTSTSGRPSSVRYQNHDHHDVSSGIHHKAAWDEAGVYAISMTTPRKYDSLRKIDGGPLEDEEILKQHTWYQAGIPREIALEILMQQEIGSFIVRDSTTHAGCFALSVKVPKFENPAGISHYLIYRTRNGVKLKGLDKEWPCLSALVTHHTVMPEMLPCTLRLPRNAANPAFNETERGDKEEDEDYQKLSDFSTMMAELKKL